MLSTLLLYPTCPECEGNLPFVSRHYVLRSRWDFGFSRRRRDYPELTAIECPSCGAYFSVQERGFGILLAILVAICVVGYLIWGEDTQPGVGFLYFAGASALVLFAVWLGTHRMTVLTPSNRPGEPSEDAPPVADVYAQLEARDAQLKRSEEEQREP